MSQRPSFSAMIAVSSLIAAPVLAQTMNSTSTPSASPPSASVTAPAGTRPAATTPMDRSATATNGDSSDSKFITADQQTRASKLIGSSVYNDQQEKIGSIDELLVGQNHDVDGVVLSVGGFLGVGSKLVKVPYTELHVKGSEIVMPGATKEQLTHMPDYKFACST